MGDNKALLSPSIMGGFMNKRDEKMDVVKGLLVIGMVLCHIYQFFVRLDLHSSANQVTWYINAVTFSGFVATFGYTNNLVYYSKSIQSVWKKMLGSSVKMLFAFYISGIAFRVFVTNIPIKWTMLKEILLLNDIPGWSEFIISFSIYLLVGLLGFSFFNYIKRNKTLHLLLIVALLFTTFLPYEKTNSTILGLLIGTKNFAAFPVLQYMPFYLIGIYFQEHGIKFNKWILILSIVLSNISLGYIFMNNGQLPERFPPSIYWIILPTLPIYLYFLLGILLTETKIVGGKIDIISHVVMVFGKNSMFYLLTSNILIFAASGTKAFIALSPFMGLVVTICLLFALTLLKEFVKKEVKVPIFML